MKAHVDAALIVYVCECVCNRKKTKKTFILIHSLVEVIILKLNDS